MTPEQIARVCHEVNRAYCESIGDRSQLHWEQAPEWQQKSAIKGVEFALSSPGVTPEQMHDSWCDEKLRDGWKVGPVKDPAIKEHPCLVDYDQLPPEQRVKDQLFRAVVGALSGKEVPAVQIGKYELAPCPHGGLWLSLEDGEGMQVVHPDSIELEALIEDFWKEHF